jgi:hypothetical protein
MDTCDWDHEKERERREKETTNAHITHYNKNSSGSSTNSLLSMKEKKSSLSQEVDRSKMTTSQKSRHWNTEPHVHLCEESITRISLLFFQIVAIREKKKIIKETLFIIESVCLMAAEY